MADQKDEIKQSQEEIKQALGEQGNRQEKMNTELKAAIQQLRTEQKDLEKRIEQRFNEKIQLLEQKMSNMEEHGTSPIVGEEIQQLKKKILEMEKGDTTTGLANSIKLKLPTFDGKSFEIFQVQFETLSTSLHWSEADKVAALIVALKGGV